MPHVFPPLPAFIDQHPESPISEIALRVIVELDGWEFHVAGTACVIGPHLAVTAGHVIDGIMQRFGAKVGAGGAREIHDYNIRLYQVMPGPIYRIWSVDQAWTCPVSDIAILHLMLHGSTDEPERGGPWKSPRLRSLPPRVGERVLAFGYRESVFRVSVDAATHHLELDDRPTMSGGYVSQVFPKLRDRGLLKFPCFEIEARFDGGMSGGVVIDEAGSICGLISVGLDETSADLPPIGYAATLWPLFGTLISADRGWRHPSGIYPVIQLARDGVVSVTDLASLEMLLPALLQMVST